VHEEGFQLEWRSGGAVEFRTPHGHLLPEAPSPPRSPIDPFEALVRRLENGAIVVDPFTGTPTWDGTRPDLGLAVEWFLTKTNPEPVGERGRSSTEPEAAGLQVDEGEAAEEVSFPVTGTEATPSIVDAEADDEDEGYQPSLARITQLAAIIAELRCEPEFYGKYVAKSADPSSFHDAVWNPELAAEWSDD
jgi:hypothetical protein